MPPKQKRGLGKGLDALLGEYSAPAPSGVTEIDIRLLDVNKAQPRKQFDEEKLNELAESIRRHGMVQPILVQQKGDRYLIVAGERRYRAARKAGLSTVPVIVRDLADEQVMELALIENIQRENLNPVEEAAAVRFLMQQHDLTQEEVSERISKSRSAVANTLRLLSLPEEVLEYLRDGRLSSGHGRALAAVKEKKEQLRLAEETVKNGYSVRQLEALVKSLGERKPAKKKASSALTPELHEAEERFRTRLGTKVKISGSEKRGKITIEYYSKEDLLRVYDTLLGGEE